jgi:hypothetical protein
VTHRRKLVEKKEWFLNFLKTYLDLNYQDFVLVVGEKENQSIPVHTSLSPTDGYKYRR